MFLDLLLINTEQSIVKPPIINRAFEAHNMIASFWVVHMLGPLCLMLDADGMLYVAFSTLQNVVVHSM